MDLQLLEPKEDSRGTLVEAYKFPNDGQLFYVKAFPGEMRGNHYHLRKTERFLVIEGAAEIMSRDRDTGNVMKVVASGTRPLVVTIPPNNTHSITALDDGCLFLVWVDEQFNEKDADTFAEEI